MSSTDYTAGHAAADKVQYFRWRRVMNGVPWAPAAMTRAHELSVSDAGAYDLDAANLALKATILPAWEAACNAQRDAFLAWLEAGGDKNQVQVFQREEPGDVATWMEQRTAPGGWTSGRWLYQDYQKWCCDADKAAVSETAFGRMLTEHGYQPKRQKAGIVRGLTLKPGDSEGVCAAPA